VLCIRNVLPAPFLGPRFLEARSCVLFSATLNPRQFYSDTLGLPQNQVWIDVESPFRAEQLQVRLARHISTRYQDRAASLQAVVDLLVQQYRQRPGNYLAFFSSFDYLQQVTALLAVQHPELPFWEQTRGMHETARGAFLERFTCESRGIGFAVLGGAFSEGIDLPGDRLIGAFIATLGLPQVNPVNEQMKARMDQLFGTGYDYTYLYPGVQKVVQAAGRVIRTTDDRGVVHLIDDRFARPQVRRLLPSWWSDTV
jgi:DNA excision repair protein ERCC-2